jgi:hypothetical protein
VFVAVEVLDGRAEAIEWMRERFRGVGKVPGATTPEERTAPLPIPAITSAHPREPVTSVAQHPTAGPTMAEMRVEFEKPRMAVGPDAQPTEPEVPMFASANLGPGINPDIRRIVETIYAVDASKTYDELEQNLEVGDQRGDYGTLQKHLDKAEDRARRAHQIYLSAKLEFAGWEIDNTKVMAAMRSQATQALEAEKAAGDRKKAITNDDVTSAMAEIFPDQWKAQEITRVKLKGTVEHLERLADLWKNKCHSLGTLLSTLRK